MSGSIFTAAILWPSVQPIGFKVWVYTEHQAADQQGDQSSALGVVAAFSDLEGVQSCFNSLTIHGVKL